MDIRSKSFRLKNELQVLWRMHRVSLLFMLLCVIAGIIIAAVVVSNPLMTHSRISLALIDSNISNAITTKATIGNFLFGRFLDIGLGLLFLFIACLHSWTALICFPYLVFRGFALVINLYWIMARFGAVAGGILLISYAFFLIIVTIAFVCATLFIMHQCAQIRNCGMRMFAWRRFFRQLVRFTVAVALIALLEWLVYAVVISKMVFIL